MRWRIAGLTGTDFTREGLTWLLATGALRIIDLAEAGREPMPSEDGPVVIVFNGEIYNYVEAPARLRRAASNWPTATREVLLAPIEAGRKMRR